MRANVGGDRNDRAFMGESVVTDQPIREVSVERPSDGSNGSTTTAEAHNCSLFWPPAPLPRSGAGHVELAGPPPLTKSTEFPRQFTVFSRNFTDFYRHFADFSRQNTDMRRFFSKIHKK